MYVGMYVSVPVCACARACAVGSAFGRARTRDWNMKVTEPTPPPAGSAAASPPEADAEITARLSRDSLARVMEEMRTRDPAVSSWASALPARRFTVLSSGFPGTDRVRTRTNSSCEHANRARGDGKALGARARSNANLVSDCEFLAGLI